MSPAPSRAGGSAHARGTGLAARLAPRGQAQPPRSPPPPPRGRCAGGSRFSTGLRPAASGGFRGAMLGGGWGAALGPRQGPGDAQRGPRECRRTDGRLWSASYVAPSNNGGGSADPGSSNAEILPRPPQSPPTPALPVPRAAPCPPDAPHPGPMLTGVPAAPPPPWGARGGGRRGSPPTSVPPFARGAPRGPPPPRAAALESPSPPLAPTTGHPLPPSKCPPGRVRRSLAPRKAPPRGLCLKRGSTGPGTTGATSAGSGGTSRAEPGMGSRSPSRFILPPPPVAEPPG